MTDLLFDSQSMTLYLNGKNPTYTIIPNTILFCSSMESFVEYRVKSNVSIMFFSFVTGKVSKHIIFGIDSFSHYIKSSQFLLLNPLFDDFSFSSPGMHILHSQCFFSTKRHEVRWWAVAQ